MSNPLVIHFISSDSDTAGWEGTYDKINESAYRNRADSLKSYGLQSYSTCFEYHWSFGVSIPTTWYMSAQYYSGDPVVMFSPLQEMRQATKPSSCPVITDTVVGQWYEGELPVSSSSSSSTSSSKSNSSSSTSSSKSNSSSSTSSSKSNSSSSTSSSKSESSSSESSQSSDSSLSSLEYSSSSSSDSSQSNSSSSESSGDGYTLIGYLCCEINGSNTKNHYLPIFRHTTEGYSPSDRDFWGDLVASPVNLVENGFISNTINGTTYWLHIYMADPSTSCCTNIEGTFRPV